MLEVQIENIVPVTEARDRFNQIIDAIEETDQLYVMTKNGKPAAIMVGVHHLEKLTGESHETVFGPSNPPASNTPDVTPPPTEPLNGTNAATIPAPDSSTTPLPSDNTPLPPEPAPLNSTSAPAAPLDNVNASPDIQPAPAANPNPLGDISGNVAPGANDGQALAPDAVTPVQTGVPAAADPFALPNEPLDLPEDKDVQGGQTGGTPSVADSNSQPPVGNQPPTSGQN